MIERHQVTDEEMGQIIFDFQEELYRFMGTERLMEFPDGPWVKASQVAGLLKNGWTPSHQGGIDVP